jgi:hypothetical protein
MLKTKTLAVLGASAIMSLAVSAPANATVPHHFANCTAMHHVFPHGAGLIGAHDHTSGTPVTNFARAPRWYNQNTSLDRDKDHIACEAA